MNSKGAVLQSGTTALPGQAHSTAETCNRVMRYGRHGSGRRKNRRSDPRTVNYGSVHLQDNDEVCVCVRPTERTVAKRSPDMGPRRAAFWSDCVRLVQPPPVSVLLFLRGRTAGNGSLYTLLSRIPFPRFYDHCRSSEAPRLGAGPSADVRRPTCFLMLQSPLSCRMTCPPRTRASAYS
jgi:hypothetical protein